MRTQASFDNIRKWLGEISRYAGDHVTQNIITTVIIAIITILIIAINPLIMIIPLMITILTIEVTRLLVGNKADLADKRVVAPDLAQVSYIIYMIFDICVCI